MSDLAWRFIDALILAPLNKREKEVLMAIAVESLGRNQTSVFAVSLDKLAKRSGWSRGNVHEALGCLVEGRYVDQPQQYHYAVHMPFEDWAAVGRKGRRRKVDQEALRPGDQEERRQGRLLPQAPCLNEALRETNLAEGPMSLRDACKSMRRAIDGGDPGRAGTPAGLPALGLSATGRIGGPGRPEDVPDSGTNVPDSGTNVPDSGTNVPDSGTLEPAFFPPHPPIECSEVQSLELCTKTLNSELSRKGVRGEPCRAVPDSGTRRDYEADWLERVRDLVGDKTLQERGGWYRKRLREDPRKFERVFADVLGMKREGVITGTPGGCFWWLWVTEFGAHPERAK